VCVKRWERNITIRLEQFSQIISHDYLSQKQKNTNMACVTITNSNSFRSVSPPPTTFEGAQDTMLAASHGSKSYKCRAKWIDFLKKSNLALKIYKKNLFFFPSGVMLAHTTLPQKPPVAAGVEKHKTDRNSDRRYRVLSELTTTCSDHHYIQEPESTPRHRKRLNGSKEYLSPRQTAVADACVSFENSRLPPTPSEYSTGEI
jgi:hypothetical protein